MLHAPHPSKTQTVDIRMRIGPVDLDGTLTLPEAPARIVLFAHGSGSSRLSPRNQFVARELHEAGIATLLFDLLTEREEVEEQYTRHLRFDIDLLTTRLIGATDWVSEHPPTAELSIGYFGASTGAAAALQAAALRPRTTRAVVSRGGRPDLAMSVLNRVRAPTLLIVGGRDGPVIEMNRRALAALRCEKQLQIVPGATHLFEEPGTLETVAQLACRWFSRHITPAGEGL